MDNAAEDLLGRTLATGWKVIEKIKKEDGHTGSFFSVCYKVEKNGEIFFLKAFNFSKFAQISSSSSVMDVMGEMINAFNYEKELSKLCEEYKVRNVVYVISHGEELVSGYAIQIVPYLIFDLADGDVRTRLNFSQSLEYSWRLQSLHNISVGLNHLHKAGVSHQDLKPSNVLVFKDVSKIGDLGRSMCNRLDAPHLRGLAYSGDLTYSPPEIMYGYYEQDWAKRSYATDCYLLGSLTTFYFAGISMTALIANNLHPSVLWNQYHGTYDEVLDYLHEAFEKALFEFKSNINDTHFRNELSTVIRYLCNPDPKLRGHPKNISYGSNNFDLQRIITKFDYLKRKAFIHSLRS